MDTNNERFGVWLDRHLDERGWDVAGFARAANIGSSLVYRWKRGYRPNVDNCRHIARTLRVPMLEVLVAAGLLTKDEAQADVSVTPSIADFTLTDLTRELHRRAEQAEQRDEFQPEQLPVQTLARIVQGLTQQDGPQPQRQRAPLKSVPASAEEPRIVTDEQGNRYAMQPLDNGEYHHRE